MIKNLNSNSKHLRVSLHHGATISPYSPAANTGAIGMVRYNPTSSTIEAYDGGAWQNINSSADIKLTDDTEALLDWAMTQKQKQDNLERLAKDNVTIRDALQNLHKAEEALHIILTLCESESSSGAGTA